MEWLQKRITYIYSAGRGNSGFVSNSSMAVFENPFIPFTDHVAVPKLGIGAQAKFLGIWQAENIGSESYAQAKQNGVAYDFESPEGKTIPVLSPRVGLISVSGLFAPQFYPNPMLLKTEANSIYRLGVLFHEARHSDGSGRHLGFPHNLCPEGHDYAGQSACDDTLNGAYTVGAHVMNELMMNCKDCSEEDLSSLQSSIHNDLQRVNKEIPVSEYAVNETMAACKKVKEAAESSPFEMKFSQKLILDDCPLAIEFQNKIRRAEWVDPAPEFLKLRSPILMMDNSAP